MLVAKSASENLPDLTGKSLEEAKSLPVQASFVDKGMTLGGCQKWYHADGSKVQIRPNGEVVRTAPKIVSQQGNTYRPRIDRNGNKTDQHNTDEILNINPREAL